MISSGTKVIILDGQHASGPSLTYTLFEPNADGTDQSIGIDGSDLSYGPFSGPWSTNDEDMLTFVSEDSALAYKAGPGDGVDWQVTPTIGQGFGPADATAAVVSHGAWHICSGIQVDPVQGNDPNNVFPGGASVRTLQQAQDIAWKTGITTICLSPGLYQAGAGDAPLAFPPETQFVYSGDTVASSGYHADSRFPAILQGVAFANPDAITFDGAIVRQ
jgi:hypothetical protein